MIKMSKRRLIGNALFLTVGPYIAARIGLQNPQLLWPTIFLMLAVRIAVELILYRRRQRPKHVSLQLHKLAVAGKTIVDESPAVYQAVGEGH